MRALLKDGPLKGTAVDIDAIEGRPPTTIEVSGETATYRYCLEQLNQEGMTAAYTFLYPVQ